MTTDHDEQHPTDAARDDSTESLQQFAHSIQEKTGAVQDPTAPETAAAASIADQAPAGPRPHADNTRRLTRLATGIVAGVTAVLGFLVGRFLGKRSG